MSDHPNLEKLDPSVRDIVREVFRDRANGAPDNISKAGCLALAMQGHEAWNAWREAFPVEHVVTNSLLNLTAPKNHADFSHLEITQPIFCYFQFGDHASFENSISLGLEAVFENCSFGENCTFRNAVFNGSAVFLGSRFGGYTSFYGVIFQNSAKFDDCQFDSLDFRAGEKLSDSFDLKTISFDNVIFRKDVNFSNRKFKGKTSFGHSNLRLEAYLNSDSTTFAVPPIFDGCEFYDNTSFEDAVFPKPIGSAQHSNAYRKLKKTFASQSNQKEEQRFFRLEMAEEAAMATGFEQYLYGRYKAFSDYGFSVVKPIWLLFWTFFAFLFIYGVASLSNCKPDYCQFNSAWIEFTLVQALPLPGLDKLSESLRDMLFYRTGAWSVAVTAMVILHKSLSLLALFLIGLGLRNLFKLK